MQANEIQGLLQQHFGKAQNFDAGSAQDISTALAGAVSAVSKSTGGPVSNPTATQQQCYAKCQQTRDAALAAAALKGWPLGAAAAAAGIMAFNACRHNCDQSP